MHGIHGLHVYNSAYGAERQFESMPTMHRGKTKWHGAMGMWRKPRFIQYVLCHGPTLRDSQPARCTMDSRQTVT